MTEEQKAIVASFPKRDRGIKDPDEEEAPDLDPLDAAALRAKLKQKQMKERRVERGDDLKKVRFEDGDDYEELSDDSSELYYDSEEEAKAD